MVENGKSVGHVE